MSEEIVNKKIDVVQLHSLTDLTLETNTQIRFSTSNILINYIPFVQYIRNVVFAESYTTIPEASMNDNIWIKSVNTSSSGLVDLTGNDGEMIIDEIHTSGINTTHSHINNKHHYINLSAGGNIRFTSENIAFNNYSDQLTSMSNYVYNVINSGSRTGVETVPHITSGTKDVTNLGTYVGNKITTDKLSTTDVMVDGSEPILIFDSMTGVNMVSTLNSGIDVGSNIYMGSMNLLELIKSQLDENGLLNLEVTFSSGQNIGITLDNFTNGSGGSIKPIFSYSVLFQLYEDPDPAGHLTLENPHSFEITREIRPTIPFTSQSFTLGDETYPLEPGKFYTVVTTFTNLRTNTVVENVILIPRSVPTIELITELDVIIINETKFKVTFTGHATHIPGITVRFKVKIDWSSESLIPYYDSTITQDLGSEPSKLINFELYTINLFSTNYDSQYVKNNTAHTFQIQSESGSFAIMNTPVFNLHAYTFNAPSIPNDLSVFFVETNTYRFSWIESSGEKLSIIIYKLFRNDEQISSNLENEITCTINRNLDGMVGSWTIRAYNVYNQYTESSVLTINNPTVTINDAVYSSARTFKFQYSISNHNGTYNISGTGIRNIETAYINNGSIFTDQLNNYTPRTSFDITMIDILGFTQTITKNILLYNPSVVIGSLVFQYSDTLRQFYIQITVTNANNGWSVDSAQIYSSTGTYLPPIDGNKLHFRFQPNETNGGKTVVVNIVDGYGFTRSVSSNVQLNVSFDEISTSITVHDAPNISFDAVGLTSYQWYLAGSPPTLIAYYLHSSVFTLTGSHFGNIYCVATQTNIHGFTRSITSETVNNNRPTISHNSFTGFNIAVSPPTPLFTYSLGPNTDLVSTSMDPNQFTFIRADLYTVSGIFKNSYNIQLSITIGTFTSTLPTQPSITHVTDISHNSMKIHYNLGANGSPAVNPQTITLLYSDLSENNSVSIDPSSPVIGSIIVGSLAPVTTYYFTIRKEYPTGSYETIIGPDFTSTTSTMPENPSIDWFSASVIEQRIRFEWNISNGDYDDIVPTIIYSTDIHFSYINNNYLGVAIDDLYRETPFDVPDGIYYAKILVGYDENSQRLESIYGGDSPTQLIITTDPPGPATSLGIYAYSNVITITFTQPSQMYDYTSSELHYKIQLYEINLSDVEKIIKDIIISNDSTYHSVTINATDTSGGPSGGHYFPSFRYYFVVSITIDGDSYYHAATSASILGPPVPGPAISLHLNAISGPAIQIGFTQPREMYGYASNELNYKIQLYEIRPSDEGGSGRITIIKEMIISNDSTDHSVIIPEEDLDPPSTYSHFYEYRFKVGISIDHSHYYHIVTSIVLQIPLGIPL